jgi:hypothetical protein
MTYVFIGFDVGPVTTGAEAAGAASDRGLPMKPSAQQTVMKAIMEVTMRRRSEAVRASRARDEETEVYGSNDGLTNSFG